MRMRFFKIPLHAGSEEEAVNRVLSSQRVFFVDRQFIQAGDNSAWAVCVSVIDGEDKAPLRKGKIDYRKVLDDANFKAFAKLRNLRKQLAAREGVPAYALFTNVQLAEMGRRRATAATTWACACPEFEGGLEGSRSTRLRSCPRGAAVRQKAHGCRCV